MHSNNVSNFFYFVVVLMCNGKPEEKNKFEGGSSQWIISCHAPRINPTTRYRASPLQPAFNSLDMIEAIEKYQPNHWVYGHTHECDDQTLDSTRIVSNQRGYPHSRTGFECEGFDPGGVLIEIQTA